MSFRKIIQFGKSSYVVTLPKAWLNFHKLSKGDSLQLEESKNILKLHPGSVKQEREVKSIDIQVDGKNYHELKRRILSVCINNHSIIRLSGKELSTKSIEIRDILNEIAAVEVVENSNNKIIVEDLLDIQTLNLDTLIRRMDAIIRNMATELIESQSPEKDLIKELNGFDKDVNRMAFLSLRIIKYYTDNPFENKTDLTNANLIGRWLIVSNLENLADNIKRIGRLKEKIKKIEKDREKIIELANDVRKMYEKTMSAFYRADYEMAYQIAHENRKFIDKIDECIYKNIKSKLEVVGSFSEKLKLITDNIYGIVRAFYTLK